MAHLLPHYSEQFQTCIHVISLASPNNGLLNFRLSRTKFEQLNKTDCNSMNQKTLEREIHPQFCNSPESVLLPHQWDHQTERVSLVTLLTVNGSCETCTLLILIWSAQRTDQMFMVRLLRLTDIEICCERHLLILHATRCYGDQSARVQTPRHTSAVTPSSVRSVSTT